MGNSVSDQDDNLLTQEIIRLVQYYYCPEL